MAFKVGKYRVGLNKQANAFTIIMGIAMLFLWFYVGGEVIETVLSLVAPGGFTGTEIFYQGFKIFGVHTWDGTTLGTSGSGLIGIIGLLLGIAVLLQAIKITRV